MTPVIALPVVAVVVATRVWLRRRRRTATRPPSSRTGFGLFSGSVALVAVRDIRQRVRGRVFRIGTLLILAAVAAAIVIPTLTKSASHPQQVGVVGALGAAQRSAVESSATSVGTTVHLVHEASMQTARSALRSGRIDLAVVRGQEVVVNKKVDPTDTSTAAQLVQAIAKSLGVIKAVEAADLSPRQTATLTGAHALPVTSLQPGPAKRPTHSVSPVGLILVFLMLEQYCTWTLIGVMEEKSSRVVEVLLAAVRPVQLLAGKVLGIGLVALAQATTIVVFAIVLAKAVGADLSSGTGPVVLFCTLLWLLLGYAFYCWVYAAAGSTVERQDQIQSLALPLNVPIVFGYIVAVAAAASGTASTFFKVLAYLPPTAPFAMPVLVGLKAVTWWEFMISVALSIVCTVGVARLAASVYRRAILRTGRRVSFRELFAPPPT